MFQFAGGIFDLLDFGCSTKDKQDGFPEKEEDLFVSVEIPSRKERPTLVCGNSFASSQRSLAVIVTK